MADVAPEDIRLSLTRICESEEFVGSQRLQGLLVYVVEETLAGRGDEIRAKTIGLDVYHYSPDEIEKREGVVRVDAGRVRRKLEAYYERAGLSDPVQISLPVGTYRPSFTPLPAEPPTNERAKVNRVAMVLGAVCAVAIIGFGLVFGVPAAQRELASSGSVATNRLQIFDLSPARVEAANLANEGRDLIFPAVDVKRLMLALQVFNAAIEKDGTYFGGYAGAAQVHATLGIDGSGRAEAASKALKDGSAVRTAIPEPSTGRCLGICQRQRGCSSCEAMLKEAVELSHRAFETDPLDPHVLEFDSLISLYTLDYDRIIDLSRQRKEAKEMEKNFVFENALGSAMFHTSDYDGAITQIEAAIDAGAPFGPITVTYLMASYQMIGDQYEASRLARLMAETWPDARVVDLKRRLFTEATPADQLASALAKIVSSE